MQETNNPLPHSMNTQAANEITDNIQQDGKHALSDLKETLKDKIVDPVVKAAQSVSSATREGAEKVADYSQNAARATDEWVHSNPYSAAGVAFGMGILLGVMVTKELRS